MASKRDLQLRQLGITQFTLRHPGVTQGEVPVSLSPKVRLLIIAKAFPDPHNLLFCDVLRTLKLTPAQTYGLTPDQVVMLPKNTKCNSWRLGIEKPLEVAGVQLYSPALTTLSQDSQAKRSLWNQIYTHEQYF
ncbi:DNA polymerase III subunit psi [Serratia symbiotica]|nr:DNA polymerase III subunit psi [Serratia symbiotica]